ncbi:sensor histidine kinase [Chondromyces crocatus]|uniref:histidine kinase n=1 Tax=Chondromyces crocatus TaxID=52 RepID=A0A0K1EHE1_CHOCO|nr:HAMP domain-containing sensor histidine kinase [Chondromyces crocatus]AKT40291.1 histidine kinase [Chondromyces crocatus]
MKLRLRLAVTTLVVTAPTLVALVAVDSQMRHSAAEQVLTRIAFQHMLQPGAQSRCETEPDRWGGTPLPRSERPPPGADSPWDVRPAPPEAPPWGAPPSGAPWPMHHGPPEEPPWDDPPPRPPFPSWSDRDASGPPPRAGEPPVLFAYDERFESHNHRAPPLAPELIEAISDRDIASPPLSFQGAIVEVLIRMPWGKGPCTFVLARGTTGPGFLGAILPASRIWLIPVGIVSVAVLLAVGPVVRRIRKLTEAVRQSAFAGFTESVSIGGRDEITELGRAFDAASRAVRTQLAEKDLRERALRDFLANTTHDVMIPLTVLQAHLSTLQESTARGEAVDMSVLVSAMDEAHYLASLVHNLAIAAKLDAGEQKLHRGPVDLNALVTRVIGRHRPIARQLEISLDHAVPELPLIIEGDVTLIEQAVSNVVYNAIRHNHPGGHVAVVVEPIQHDRFRLRVLDDGPGIPADDLTRLVERGFRGNEARTRAPDGQGLGLNIACRVAELHGLSLNFQPSEYGGLQVDLEGTRLPA